MGEDFPAVPDLLRLRDFLRVDRNHDALIAEFFRGFAYQDRRSTAAVLIETLSAPDASSTRTSSTERTPPPTVSGMKQASAVRRTTSSRMPRLSLLAVMSRKQKLVGAGGIVCLRGFDRIAGIAQFNEVNAL